MQFVQKIMGEQFALPTLFFGADALSETGLENWMRLTIYIDKNGQIISANKLRMPARNYPVCIEKQNRKLRIFISKKITTDALLALINHIRILKDSSMELVSELPSLDSDIFDEANYCFLRLGQACLALFEAARKGKFLSHVDFWEEATDDADQLPFEITNLTRLKIAHLDTPTALAQLLQNQTANAAFYHFTADHHLALMRLPENMVHPPIPEEATEPLKVANTEETYLSWLQIPGHIAIATAQPLRQFGHIQLGGWPDTGMHPFIKLLLPIASEFERPKNYRLITVTYLIHQKAYIL